MQLSIKIEKMHFSEKDIKELNRVRRLNLINGISGIKPANLIGTYSKSGTNLSIFSSVVHIGSDPALLGFIMRPLSEVRRDTFENIKSNGSFTINHIHESIIEQAHYTSAKIASDQSEFEICGLTEEYLDDFSAPYVKESHLKIGLKFIEKVDIKSNGTSMIIGEIKHLYLPEECLDDKGYIRLDRLFTAGIGGLNSYYKLHRITSFPYARPDQIPKF